MSLIASVCVYCGHKQFVGTEILQYRCQLCGRNNELHQETTATLEEEATALEDRKSQDITVQSQSSDSVSCGNKDKYQSDLIDLKLKAVKDRSEIIEEFWDCESIWEGSDQDGLVGQIFDNEDAFRLYFAEALIKAKIFGPESIEFDLGTTYDFFEVQKCGPFGLFGTEFVPISYIEIVFWARRYIPSIVENLSEGAFSAVFSETSIGPVREYPLEYIENSITVGILRHARGINYAFAMPKALKCEVVYQDNRPLPEWIMRTWPMIEHLKSAHKEDLEALKATQLISDICEECSAFNFLHELKPKSERTFARLFRTGYGTSLVSPLKSYSASLGHVNSEEYRELTIDEVALIALTLDSIPDFDYYIDLGCTDKRSLSFVDNCKGDESITLTSASKEYPSSSKSVIEELISA